MNYKQRKVAKKVREFIKWAGLVTFVIPNKKNKLHKRADDRFVSHRALVKTTRRVLKKRGHI